jgi:hypothetical protein
MFARFIFLLILVSPISAFADKIVAVVEKNPITLSDIENRKNLIIALQKINKDFYKQNLKDFDKHIYEMLVQERIVENQAQISEANISSEELQNSIAADEKSKKFQPGYMKKTLGQLLYSDYTRYVNGQILWSRMINETLSSIRVLPQESDYLILSSNSKDMDLRFYELRSKRYSVLKNLKERLGARKEMKKISESSSLKIDDTSARFTSLNIDVQNIIKNLQIGDTSSITLDGDEFRMFFLDDKKFVGLSKEEMMFVNQVIGNQKAEMLVKQISNFMKKRTFISKVAS